MWKSFLQKKSEKVAQKQSNFLFLQTWGALVGLALAGFNMVFIALFLYVVGAENLPQALFVAGLLGFILSITLAFLQNYLGIIWIASGSLFLVFIYLVFLPAYIQVDSGGVNLLQNPLFWTFALLYPVNNTFKLIFESLFHHLFNIRDAKRLMSRANSGKLIASALGGLLLIAFLPETSSATTTYLMLILRISTGVFFLAFLLSLLLASIYSDLRFVQNDIKEVRSKNTFFQLLERPYFVSLSLSLGLALLLGFSVDYFFWFFTADRFELGLMLKAESNHLPNFVFFLGVFLGVTYITSLAFKRLLFRYLTRKFGLRNNLMGYPAGVTLFLLLAAVTSLIYFQSDLRVNSTGFLIVFIFVLLTKFFKDVLEQGVKLPVFRLYLLPIDADLRPDIQTKIEGGVWNIALWASGLILWVLQTQNWQIRGGFYLMTGIGVLMFWVIILLHRQYRRVLEEKLNQAQRSDEEKQPQSLARNILKNIQHIPPHLIPLNLNLLNILNPVLYREAILKLLDSSDNQIRFSLEFFIAEARKILEPLSSGEFFEESPAILKPEFELLLPFEEEIRGLIRQLDRFVMEEKDRENERVKAQKVKDHLLELLKDFQNNTRQLALSIDDETQRIALAQAAHFCVLEGIPVLSVLCQSKYFSVFDNAGLILNTNKTLKGAEFRLERVKYIRQLTLSKRADERVFGALLTIYSDTQTQEELLPTLLQDMAYPVRYQALVAASGVRSTSMYYKLIERLGETRYSNAAFAALVSIGEDTFPYLEDAFNMTGQKEAIQRRIIQIYGRLGSNQAVELLLNKLKDANHNITRTALKMLSLCGRKMKEENESLINSELREVCEDLVWNLAVLHYLDDKKINTQLKEALESEVLNNYDEVFSLIALLYEPASVQLVRQSLNSGDPEQAEFARELLNILLDETVKPVLLPLLDVSTSYREKLRSLQDEYPTEAVRKLTRAQILTALIQRDYKSINRWTKACALMELAEQEDFHDPLIFLANVVNPNVIISEIAYRYLKEHHADIFENQLDFLEDEAQYRLMKKLSKDMAYLDQADVERAGRIHFEMVSFLQESPSFRGIPGLILADLADLAEWQSFKKGEIIGEYSTLKDIDYYVIFRGKLALKSEGIHIQYFEQGDFVNDFNYINEVIPQVELEAETEGVIFKIPRENFQALISNHDEIPLALQKHNEGRYQLAEILKKAQLLPSADTLSLDNLMNIAKIHEVSEDQKLAHYPFAEQMDTWVAISGSLQIRDKEGKVLSKSRFISAQDWQESKRAEISVWGEEDTQAFQFNRHELSELSLNLNKVHFLRRMPIFQNLAGVTLMEVARAMQLQEFKAEVNIANYAQAEDCDAWFIKSGKLEYSLGDVEENPVWDSLSTNESLNALFFLEQGAEPLNIESERASALYFIPQTKFRSLMLKFNQLSLNILERYYPDTLLEIVSFLLSIPRLQKYKAYDLIQVAQLIQVKYYQAGDRIATYSEWDEVDFWIIYSGKVQIEFAKRDHESRGDKVLIYASEFKEKNSPKLRLRAEEDSVMYLIRKHQFSDLVGHAWFEEFLAEVSEEHMKLIE